MIIYGEGTKRSLFKDGKDLYSRIVDASGQVSFVELHPEKFADECEFCEKFCEDLSRISDFSFKVLEANLELILDLNGDLFRLQETAEAIKKMRPNDGNLQMAISKSIADLQDKVEVVTSAVTQFVSENFPHYYHKYESIVSEALENRQKIEAEESEIEDFEQTRLLFARLNPYRALIIKDMFGGKKDFSVGELSEARGVVIDEVLEKKYQRSFKQKEPI